MVASLRTVIVKRPEEAFRSRDAIEKEWNDLGYTRPPDLNRASREHETFVSLLTLAGAAVLYLPADDRTGLDSIYTHDPVLITEAGAVIFQTGKPARRGEGPAFTDALKEWDVPVLGTICGAGAAEAGDMVWLDRNTLLVGRGFRTNGAGLEALAGLLTPLQVRIIPVQLPYWNGPGEVLHLMSFVSLLDDDLAVVYRRRQVAVVGAAYAGTVGIPALFDRSRFPDLMALAGDVGAKAVLRAEGDRLASIECPAAAFDVDAEADALKLR